VSDDTVSYIPVIVLLTNRYKFALSGIPKNISEIVAKVENVNRYSTDIQGGV